VPHKRLVRSGEEILENRRRAGVSERTEETGHRIAEIPVRIFGELAEQAEESRLVGRWFRGQCFSEFEEIGTVGRFQKGVKLTPVRMNGSLQGGQLLMLRLTTWRSVRNGLPS